MAASENGHTVAKFSVTRNQKYLWTDLPDSLCNPALGKITPGLAHAQRIADNFFAIGQSVSAGFIILLFCISKICTLIALCCKRYCRKVAPQWAKR